MFLSLRGSATILIGATMNLNSRRPLEVFRSIPTEGWNEELQRFFNQIKTETHALSGMEFYFVTKSMLLSVIGALLVYEVVLLQFSSEAVNWTDSVDCTKVIP